ncbi:MAG: hypothetical protein AB7S26_39580 [Sandaracinaceae bacterium]
MSARNQRGKRYASWLLRLVAGAVLFMSLAGPGAGNVGGCGNTPPLVDAVQHCMDREGARCRREAAAGRISSVEFTDCVNTFMDVCMSASWPTGCAPTPAESQACVRLLTRLDFLQTPTDQLLAEHGECNLCM